MGVGHRLRGEPRVCDAHWRRGAVRQQQKAEFQGRQGAQQEQKKRLERAGRLYEELLSEEFPDHVGARDNIFYLGLLYWDEGGDRRKLAIPYLKRGLDEQEQQLRLLLATGSQDQRRRRIANMRWHLDRMVSAHLHDVSSDPDIGQLALETVFRRKGRSLDALADDAIGRARRRAAIEPGAHARPRATGEQPPGHPSGLRVSDRADGDRACDNRPVVASPARTRGHRHRASKAVLIAPLHAQRR